MERKDATRDLGIAAIAVLIFIGIKKLFDLFMDFKEDMEIIDQIEREEQEDARHLAKKKHRRKHEDDYDDDDEDDDDNEDYRHRRRHHHHERFEEEHHDDFHEEEHHDDFEDQNQGWRNDDVDGTRRPDFDPNQPHNTPELDHVHIDNCTPDTQKALEEIIPEPVLLRDINDDLREEINNMKKEMASIRFLTNEMLDEREQSVKAGNLYIRNLKYITGQVATIYENGDRDGFNVLKCEFVVNTAGDTKTPLKLLFMVSNQDTYDKLSNKETVSICGTFGKIDHDGYINFIVDPDKEVL